MEKFVHTNIRSQTEDGGSLPADTQLGYVHVAVEDLDRSLAFYQQALGFQVNKQERDTVSLGAGDDDLLKLTEVPRAMLVPRRTGLYHFAVLVPSRLSLAQSQRNLIENGIALQGGADHTVSEAIYLADPDGNGIEIYRDRPRENWEYENGKLRMGTEPLDFQGLLAELEKSPENWRGLPKNTRVGHVHLHVTDLPEAVEFYEQVLGFDLVINYGSSAAFLSAGGYHHHIGVNTWNGVGSAPPPADSVGLRYFTILVSEPRGKDELAVRLDGAQIRYEERNEGLFIRDPSENGILVKTFQ